MLTVTVEIDAPAELGQGAKEAVAMRLESLGGVRVLEVRETDGQMSMFRGVNSARIKGGENPPSSPAAMPPPFAKGGSERGTTAPMPATPPRTDKEPMHSCFNCAARFGESRLIEGKLAYGACRINRQPVRDLHGVCKQWSERR